MLENGSVKAKYHKSYTMSLQHLRKKGRKEEMFLFAVSVKPSKDSEGSLESKFPHKYKEFAGLESKIQHQYKEFADVFNKVKDGTYQDSNS